MKAGDREPPFTMYLSELVNGVSTPILLDGHTVRFVMFNSLTKAVVIDTEASVTNAEQGRIEYFWGDGETDTPGDYSILIKVIDTASGFVRSFPETGYFPWEIEKTYGI